MMPPDLFLLLHQQRHQEVVQQAEQARLVRASGRKPVGSEKRAFQDLLWWVGGALLTWGCTLQHAGGVTQANEKGCSVCL
jgi:hypothetical protein